MSRVVPAMVLIFFPLLVMAMPAGATPAQYLYHPVDSVALQDPDHGSLNPADAWPLAIGEVRYWAYQLQGIPDDGAVDALAASSYDMLVIEPTRTDWSGDQEFDTVAMVSRLKASTASDGVHRKLVIAYINIGQAEDWRWYWTWSTGWNCTGSPPADWPDYILMCDPDGWGGDYPVAYWDPAWKNIVISGEGLSSAPHGDYVSIVDETLRSGFDGVFLDWVAGFEEPAVMDAAAAAGKDPAVEMIALIHELRQYAHLRDPDFLVIQQNAAPLLEGHPELLDSIDAVAQESNWYGGEAADDWDDPNGYDIPTPPDWTADNLFWLDQYLAAGTPVFDCDYAVVHAPESYANAYARGYVPYVSRTPLSRLTTTPPDFACSLLCEASAGSSGGEAPLIVEFTASATAANCGEEALYHWDFGDGTTVSEQNPTHIYGTGGAYTWTLTVTVEDQVCTKTGVVEVTALTECSCGASGEIIDLYLPLAVQFTSTLNSPDLCEEWGYLWEFGDGSTSNDPNPMHLYSIGFWAWTLTLRKADATLACGEGAIAVLPGVFRPGDCNEDGTVSIGEVQRAINMFLLVEAPGCHTDGNADGAVSIGEVQMVINAFLG